MSIVRSTRGVSEQLFKAWEELVDGNSTPQRASAEARIANTIYTGVRLEMDNARFVAASRGADDGGLKSIPINKD